MKKKGNKKWHFSQGKVSLSSLWASLHEEFETLHLGMHLRIYFF